MTFEEWLELGLERGWMTPPACGVHDGILLDPDEVGPFEAGEEPCFPVTRLRDPKG